jgi:hypothetical protein
MSDDSESVKPGLPAVAAAPAKGPRAVLWVSIGPSPELLKVLKENPGGKLTIRLPGDPRSKWGTGAMHETDARGAALTR